MIDVLRDIEKTNETELWALLGTVSAILKMEMDTNKGDIKQNNKFQFWYDLYKTLKHEIDKRMNKEN